MYKLYLVLIKSSQPIDPDSFEKTQLMILVDLYVLSLRLQLTQMNVSLTVVNLYTRTWTHTSVIATISIVCVP